MSQTPLESARSLLLGQSYGTLSTHSLDCEGYPFGSLVPYCLDRSNRPLLLLSRLAQHTKNIGANPKVSLMVSDAANPDHADVQEAGRVTVLGDVRPLTDPDVIARYYRYYPDARDYVEQLDFDLYGIEPVKVRFIGGFGQIHWIPVKELCAESPFDAVVEREVIEHMNDDHADALLTYCAQLGLQVEESASVRMVGVDSRGFHLRVNGAIARLEFIEPAQDPNQLRQALIKLLRP